MSQLPGTLFPQIVKQQRIQQAKDGQLLGLSLVIAHTPVRVGSDANGYWVCSCGNTSIWSYERGAIEQHGDDETETVDCTDGLHE